MGSVTVSSNIADTYPNLNATSSANAVWWDDSILGRFASDAIKRLARQFGIFVARDTTSVVLAAGTALYNSPPRHCATIHVAINGTPLQAASTSELEMLDAAYQTTAATALSPIRYFYLDRNNQNKMGFYPVPYAGNVGQTVEVLYYIYPCIEDTDLSTAFTAPRIFGYLLELLMLAEAKKQESDGAAPEVAQSAMNLANLVEDVFLTYWQGVQIA